MHLLTLPSSDIHMVRKETTWPCKFSFPLIFPANTCSSILLIFSLMQRFRSLTRSNGSSQIFFLAWKIKCSTDTRNDRSDSRTLHIPLLRHFELSLLPEYYYLGIFFSVICRIWEVLVANILFVMTNRRWTKLSALRCLNFINAKAYSWLIWDRSLVDWSKL